MGFQRGISSKKSINVGMAVKWPEIFSNLHNLLKGDHRFKFLNYGEGPDEDWLFTGEIRNRETDNAYKFTLNSGLETVVLEVGLNIGGLEQIQWSGPLTEITDIKSRNPKEIRDQLLKMKEETEKKYKPEKKAKKSMKYFSF